MPPLGEGEVPPQEAERFDLLRPKRSTSQSSSHCSADSSPYRRRAKTRPLSHPRFARLTALLVEGEPRNSPTLCLPSEEAERFDLDNNSRNMEFYPQAGVILNPERLAKTEYFLEKMGLRYEGGADYTVQLCSEYGELLGNGCLCGNILKYIAVDERLQGEGAALTIVSELVSEAYRRGITKLFLFTKASNEMLFRGAGFYTLAATRDVCFMENTRSGLSRWLDTVPRFEGNIGAAVMNCNPFTLGHRFLIRTAAEQVDHLYVFVVSEDSSRFSFADRIEMVRRGTRDLLNVCVIPSGEYMISKATFPTYFIKDTANAESMYAALDVTLFGSKIAKALGITRRFVGTEPYCGVTRNYNEVMKELLPKYGVEVCEIERTGGISASRVREALDKGDITALDELVPESTLNYIMRKETL